MKSIRRYGVKDIRVEMTDEPTLKEGQVLLKTAACGVCGTDMHVYKGMANGWLLPGIIGHEFAGEVVKVTDSATEFGLGDRVTVQPLLNCGVCHHCQAGRTNLCQDMSLIGGEHNGGMAEYVAVEAKQLKRLPGEVPLKFGAFVEPTATVVHALNRRQHTSPGTAVIFGAGSLGLIALQLLNKECHQVIVVDINEDRLEVASRLGAYEVIHSGASDPEKIIKERFPEGADLVVDAAGVNAVRRTAFSAIRPGGEMVFVALGSPTYEVDFMQLVTQEISLYGSQCHTMKDYDEAIRLIAWGVINFDAMVSFMPLEQGVEAFEALAEGKGGHIKVAFTMNGEVEK